MPFDIEYTQTAADLVRRYKKFEQQIILDAIDEHLAHQPTFETRNRKALSNNDLANWELRVQRFRVFYDVVNNENQQIVRIKAVGHKEHNTLYVGDQEVEL